MNGEQAIRRMIDELDALASDRRVDPLWRRAAAEALAALEAAMVDAEKLREVGA